MALPMRVYAAQRGINGCSENTLTNHIIINRGGIVVFFRDRSCLVKTIVLVVLLVAIPVLARDEDVVRITILGTTDLHGNLFDWSYEDGAENPEIGLVKVHTIVQQIRAENANTILLDVGDTIQGTLLTDDLYNVSLLDQPHPMITAMNFMEYDAMTLGNHEFNFGLGLIDKIVQEADFPILSANTYQKSDDTHYVQPYTIKEIEGIRIGILGLTTPKIPMWDGPKVESLYFTHMASEAEKQIKTLQEEENVDLVIGAMHSGLASTTEGGADSVRYVITRNPELAAVVIGHDHATVAEMVNNTAVGAARDQGRQVVRIDLKLQRVDGKWEVTSAAPSIIEVKNYAASQELWGHTRHYHEATLEFLDATIGIATADFHPASEVPNIPEGQIRDTAVMDLINAVQLQYTGADVSAAALFKSDSNIKKGNISFNHIFDIYKYPNTLVAVQVTGAELKAYMEWSARYFNTYKPGDVTVSFDPNIRSYYYDMFAGIDYKIDISKPAGERIVDVIFKGSPLQDDDVLSLVVNDFRYNGLKNLGIISNDPHLETDPISVRTMIAEYIREKGTIAPEVDNNWSITGAYLEHPLRDYIVELAQKGKIRVPFSADGRTPNVKSLNVYELIEEGKIPEEVLKEYDIELKPAA